MPAHGGWAILSGQNACMTSIARNSAEDMSLVLSLTVAAYVGSLAGYIGYLVSGRDWSGRAGSLLLAGGLLLHYLALLERTRGMHTVPYHDLSGSLSLFGWLLAMTYLALELFHKQRSVGAFVLPFILVF